MIKHGKTPEGKQRYCCQAPECNRNTFIREYSYAGLRLQVKQQICGRAMNGSGIRDTARVLGNLSYSEIAVANMEAHLSEANLSQANLAVANLEQADLSGADLAIADLSQTNLQAADLN